MFKTEADWIAAYEAKGGLWIHDSNPLRPHALLTSGNHSNGFFNSRKIIPDDALLAYAVADLVSMLSPLVFDTMQPKRINVVVGPQTGATRLAELMAQSLTIATGHIVEWASPAKASGGIKAMMFGIEELPTLRGATVLMCEDVISTGGSILLTEQALCDAGAKPLPFVCTLVNRSGECFVNANSIIALINRPLPMWAPEECPLCAQGSEAIPAKDPANWARLTATY